ncbi:MAG: TldD/PmbA family protein [Candidatus Bathyarchaeia archaeon]
MRDLLKKVVDNALKFGAEFCDVRVVMRTATQMRIENGIAKELLAPQDFGACIRVLLNGSWGVVSINSTAKDELFKALEEAISSSKAKKGQEKSRVAEIKACETIVKSKFKIDPESVGLEEKMDKLLELEKAAREYDKKVKSTSLVYQDENINEVVCNSFNTFIDQTLTRVLARISVTAKEGTNRQSAHKVVGKLAGFEVINDIEPEEFGVVAAERAVNLLKAKRAPSGKFVVVMDPEITGLFAHEAVGHNAEGDLVAFHESLFDGMQNQKIASNKVTMIDDATIEGAYGSYYFDSEGTPASRRIIIERGVLKGFMHGLESAAILNEKPNGSCRAYLHQNVPIVRMSNTFFAPGDYTLEELIEDVKLGIFVRGARGGYVFVERGQFTCNVEEAQMIRNGELAEPLSNVSIGGLTLEILKNVEACSKDFELVDPGFCGKNGQRMWVDDGGPYIRVKDIVVGGYKE